MKKMKKRILSTALALIMALSLLPMNLTAQATAGDLVGGVTNSAVIVEEGETALDDADTDANDNTDLDGTETDTDDNPDLDGAEPDANAGTDTNDNPDLDDAETDANAETDLVGEGLAPPANLDGAETNTPLDIQISSAPNDDTETLAKFLAPVVPLDETDGYIESEWTAISDRAGLEAMSYTGKYYLTDNIDLDNEDWTPIASFSGTLDGQGYVIRDLTITGEIEHPNIGLFASVTGATIRNVGLEGTNINVAGSGYIYVGGICGQAANSTISNCYNEGKVSASSSGSGSSEGPGYHRATVGGICGANGYADNNEMVFKYCYNGSEVSASAASEDEGADTYSFNGACAGGICGGYGISNDATLNIDYCQNTGAVSASSTGSAGSMDDQACAGGICGSVSASAHEDAKNASITINKCVNAGAVSVTASSASVNVMAGGICAQAWNDAHDGSAATITISDCKNTGEVSLSAATFDSNPLEERFNHASASAGGICGWVLARVISGSATSAITIIDCENEGEVTVSATGGDSIEFASAATADTGGICGYAQAETGASVTISGCENKTPVTASSASAHGNSYAGGICGSACTNDDATYNGNKVEGAATVAIDDCHNTGDVTAEGGRNSKEAGGICGHTEGNVTITNCTNTGVVTPSGGPDIPVPTGWIEIKTADELAKIGRAADYPGNGQYYLSADLALTGNWTPIPDFSGTFDGRDKTITGLSIEISQLDEGPQSIGLFAALNGATIQNLRVEDAAITASHTEDIQVGGIAGSAYASTISNCYFSGSVTATGPNGVWAGGIVGYANSSAISECENAGTASAAATFEPFTDEIYPHTIAGGICGYAYRSSITECQNKNTGAVSASASDDNASAGGICGNIDNSSINECQNEGAVSASGGYPSAGGIGGSAWNSTISACTNAGTVTADGYSEAGGIVGLAMFAVIRNCYNTGAVSASGSYYTLAGGIVGLASTEANVSDCYNTGAVTATNNSIDYSSCRAGGIAGLAVEAALRNCYSTGAVSASDTNGAYAGGVCGSSASATIANCYWNSDSKQTVNGADRSATAKRGVGYTDSRTTALTAALTTAQMKEPISFAGFDFTNTWGLLSGQNDGYPILQAFNIGYKNVAGISLNKTALALAAGVTETLTVAFTPTDASYRAVVWETGSTAVATVDQNGLVTAKAAGQTMILARSALNPALTAICLVTVSAGAPVPATPTGDISLKLPVSAISLNTKSALGAEFAILTSDGLDFDQIEITSANKSSFALENVAGSDTLYRLKAGSPAPNDGRHTLTLQATKDGSPIAGTEARLTVTVASTIPRATVKMPTLNTFWVGASGTIAVNGANLPKIIAVNLASTGKAADGDVAQNFGVSVNGNGVVTITAKNDNKAFADKWGQGSGFYSYTDTANTKPAVKGILAITLEGFSTPIEIPVTVLCKPVAPKLTLNPQTQTIYLNKEVNNNWASFNVTVEGGHRLSGAWNYTWKNENDGNFFINKDENSLNNIDVWSSGLSINLKGTAKASNALNINLWLVGAAKSVAIKPTIKTTTKPTTYKLSPATVTLNNKAVGCEQMIIVSPSVPNGAWLHIAGVEPKKKPNNAGDNEVTYRIDANAVIVSAKEEALPGNYEFSVTLKDAPADIGPLTLKVKVVAQNLTATVKTVGKGNIDLLDRSNSQREFAVTVKNVTQGNIGLPRLADDSKKSGAFENFYIDAEAWNNSRRIVVKAKSEAEFTRGASCKFRLVFPAGSTEVPTADITIKPSQSAPKHSLPKTINFYQSRTGMNSHQVIDIAPTAPAGARVASFSLKSNPGNAYGSYYDSKAQQLHIWLADGSKVRPGKATLTFSAVYEGQGVEKRDGKAKARNVKLSVTIGK